MKLRKRSLWSLLVLMSVLLFAVPGDAFAQRRSSSSRSRPSARRSTPKRSAPKAKAATPKRAGKTGTASKKKGFGSSKKKAGKSKPKATKADVAAYTKAKANGTAFKTRGAAAKSFKAKNAKKYASTYASKPATRPGHIPQTTMVGGQSTTIIYNQGGGGYGYMNSLGTFMLYNALADAAMAPYYNRQMASAGYMYGAPPVYRSGPGAGTVILVLLAGVFVIFVVVNVRKGSA